MVLWVWGAVWGRRGGRRDEQILSDRGKALVLVHGAGGGEVVALCTYQVRVLRACLCLYLTWLLRRLWRSWLEMRARG